MKPTQRPYSPEDQLKQLELLGLSGYRRPGETLEQAIQRAKSELEIEERRRREIEERERLMAMPPEFVVTLVHGTQLSRGLLGPIVGLFKWPGGMYREFLEGPAWIQSDSRLAQHLIQALGWRVRIEPFTWKAYNSVNARAIAMGQLRERLGRLRNDYPSAEQVVIAHSHGGNVVLSALSDPVEAQRILGVATLATPFLAARTRGEIRSLLDFGDALAAALMAGFATLSIGFATGAGWSWWGRAALVFIGVVLLMSGGGWASTRMKAAAENIAEKMAPTKLAAEQVTIVRTYGDEAVAVIAGARVTGAFVNQVWRGFSEPLLQALAELLEWIDYFGLRSTMRQFDLDRAKRDSPALGEQRRSSLPLSHESGDELSAWAHFKKTATPTIGPLIATAIQDNSNPALRWVVLGIGAVYGLPALIALAITMISVVPGIVFSLGLLPCGWTVPFAGPYLDVTAEPAPSGTWRVTQFDPSNERGLAHSKSYDDARVHEHLAQWIRDLSAAKKKKADCLV
jgi:hypothetical protein